MGLLILRYCLRDHVRSWADWERWFRLRPPALLGAPSPGAWGRGPWGLYVFLGAAVVFPIVERLAELNGYLLPDLSSAMIETSLSSEDGVATMLYCAVVALCAPVWEELIFRGFLLQSLSRYLRPPAAVLASAAIFAAAHFSAHRVLPLTGLGVALGLLFNVTSRNLLACVLLHSAWNCYVLFVLL